MMQTLLDCSQIQDAAACNATREEDGLKITFEADPGVGPCVYASKYGHSIELYGAAEVREFIRALENALKRTEAALAQAVEAA